VSANNNDSIRGAREHTDDIGHLRILHGLFGQVLTATRVDEHPRKAGSAFAVSAAVFAQSGFDCFAGNQSDVNGLSLSAAWCEREQHRADCQELE
jgi:hypothetical protein